MFNSKNGIKKTYAGYTGGTNTRPSYESVCRRDGHIEAVCVEYDDTEITYEELVDIFFCQEKKDMFKNAGQYSSFIWTNGKDQDLVVRKKIKDLKKAGDERADIPTVAKATQFYVAEPYHQNNFENIKLRAFIIGAILLINCTFKLDPEIYKFNLVLAHLCNLAFYFFEKYGNSKVFQLETI
jgi:methionine-S-sulfoxide reductase